MVNAGLIPLVDAAVPSLKQGDAEVASIIKRGKGRGRRGSGVRGARAGALRGDARRLRRRASRSQLQSLFARYAAAGVAAGLDDGEGGVTEEGEAVDLAAVDTLQALFQISDKQADRLAQQVVTCVEINQCAGAPDNSSLSHFSRTGIATPSSRRRVDGVNAP